MKNDKTNKLNKQHKIERERVVWTGKKSRSCVVAARLAFIDKHFRAYRMSKCADSIISDACCACGTRYIVQVDFCRDRLCPLCSWRRSKRLAQKLSEIIAICELEKRSRYIFLTLTVRNVPWAALGGQIKTIMHSWDKMGKRLKRAASVTGWVRTFEVTRSKTYGDAHPHMHILLQVPPEYFDKKSGLHYHTKDELIRQWQECLKAGYPPSIGINAVKDTEIGRAIAEVTKYISKGSHIEGLSDEDFRYYVGAIRGVRSWSAGGRMRIKDEDIEEFLHGGEEEMTHEIDKCGNCGGKLVEMREVWSAIDKAYHVKIEMDYNSLNSQKRVDDKSNIILNINTGGGNIYVNGNVVFSGQAGEGTGGTVGYVSRDRRPPQRRNPGQGA